MSAGERTDRNVARALRPFIIAEALPLVVEMLRKDGVRVALSNRKGRLLGYYMPPKKQRSASLHTISLQIELNPYALLFVFVHEWAHLLTRKQHGDEVRPHGKEWKQNFKTLFKPFFSPSIFPPDVLQVIGVYFAKTSPYFEKELEEACHRYGKDRKAFARTYMRLLKAGVVIPAPDMGAEARKRADELLGRHQEAEAAAPVEEEKPQPVDEVVAKTEDVQEKYRVAESLNIAQTLPGMRIRMEETDYEVEELLPPFVKVRRLGNGQSLRVHGLVRVQRLEAVEGLM